MRLYYWLCIGLVLAACSEQVAPDQTLEPEMVQTVKPYTVVKVAGVITEDDYSQFPKRSQSYLHLIDEEVSNPSWFAGLIDTESRYNQFAVSPRGAIGLTQIMPSNHEWLENGMCSHLGRAKPQDPAWQVECGQILFEWGKSWNKEPPMLEYCDRQFMKSALYNGGYYIVWEVRYGGGTIIGGKNICGTLLPNGRKRSEHSCKENYAYAATISKKQKLFTNLGGTQCLVDF